MPKNTRSTTDAINGSSPQTSEPAVTMWENHTQYADRIAEIAYDTRPPAEKPAKNTE